MATSTSNNPVHGKPFIVASEVMRKFMGMAERVARHVGTVLIVGETGTGKELIAHAIHEQSLRCEQPFVEINCAALPENLVESELFGYEKGAFSGADTGKPGLFELAHLGTIFLDEIGELDLKVQVKLLRILDRAPYYRLGGHRKITSDVRVVAATNRNLKEEVSAGRFRKDLYHRLSQFELSVPPLRERPQDIVALAEHFMAQESSALRFSPDALRMLESYSWPGNVRELQNVVNKVMVSAQGPEIGLSEVRLQLTPSDESAGAPAEGTESTTDLDSLEAQAIQKALQSTGGHRGRAAEQLGISRRTLSRKLKEFGFASARRVAAVAMGSLSCEQQNDFRADVKLPISLRTPEGQEVACIATNLSLGGMGLEGLTAALNYNSVLTVHLLLPGSEAPVDVLARVAWGGAQGRAGVTFTDVSSAARKELKRWLCQKMVEEGWTVEPEEPDAVEG
ncbi:MAG: sigma 54-interacting transcriptional regulator [Acidobacteriia bacterium]|nr:sigma 54-interacting transcriptional regulator [Terriglobia bacterium]